MSIEEQLAAIVQLTQKNCILLQKNNELLERALSGAPAPEPEAETPAPEKKEKKAPKKATKKKAAKKPEPEPEPEAEEDDFGLDDVEESGSSEPQMTADDCEDVLRQLVAMERGEKARELLTNYKVKRLSQLKESQLNAFYADVKEAIDE